MRYAAAMKPEAHPFFGAVEAGGTKFVCAIGDGDGMLHAEQHFSTSDPVTTLAAILQFFERHARAFGPLAGIGVASFGPVHLDPAAEQYGHIGKTPKAGWSDTDMLAPFARFGCPLAFDTDVNAAALAEHRWGAARDVASLVYVTVGTGIGGGIVINGAPLHGLLHPEVGHIYPRRHPLDLQFQGICRFHGDCLEGLASGPAIVARTGRQLHELGADDPMREIEADYLGQLCAQLTTVLSPQRIVMGGGVMSSPALLPRIRARMLHWLGGYIDRPEILALNAAFVVAPALEQRAGVLGALWLGIQAAQHAFQRKMAVAL
jgi:fructokinase